MVIARALSHATVCTSITNFKELNLVDGRRGIGSDNIGEISGWGKASCNFHTALLVLGNNRAGLPPCSVNAVLLPIASHEVDLGCRVEGCIGENIVSDENGVSMASRDDWQAG